MQGESASSSAPLAAASTGMQGESASSSTPPAAASTGESASSSTPPAAADGEAQKETEAASSSTPAAAADNREQDKDWAASSSSAAPLSADHLCFLPEGDCESEEECETPGESAMDKAAPTDSAGMACDGSGGQQFSQGNSTANLSILPVPGLAPSPPCEAARSSVRFSTCVDKNKGAGGARSSGTTLFTRSSAVARPSLPGLFRPNTAGKAGPLTDMQQESVKEENDVPQTPLNNSSPNAATRQSSHSISMAIEEEDDDALRGARLGFRFSDGLVGSAADDGKLQASGDEGRKTLTRQSVTTIQDFISKSLLAARDNLANQHETVIKTVNERFTDMNKEVWTLQTANRGLRSEVGKLSKQIEALRSTGADEPKSADTSCSPSCSESRDLRLSIGSERRSDGTHADSSKRNFLHPLGAIASQPDTRESFQDPMRDVSHVTTAVARSESNSRHPWSSVIGRIVGQKSELCQIAPNDGLGSVGMHSAPPDRMHQVEGREKFEVLTAWKENFGTSERNQVTIPIRTRLKRHRKVHALNFAEAMQHNEADDHKERSCVERRFVINPNAPKRVWWDAFSLLLVVYDMISIPLELFDPPENTFSLILAWMSRLFWTSDIGMTFVTGILKEDGTVELRMKSIARRYIITWFLLDMTIVTLDWSELLWMDTARFGYERIGKASRTFRIVRMVRLLRLIRMRQVIRLISERIRSERLTILADMVKIILIICGLAHLIACFWYGIGAIDHPNDKSWVSEFDLATEDLGYRYATSLHWSLSQFAGGMDEVTPENINERIFAIFVFLFSFTTATVFVSSLTSSMTRLHIIGGQRQQKLSMLRRYLTENNISSRLTIRLARNAQYVLGEQERSIPEASVELIMCVSEALRVELHFEMYSPVYATHLFFMRYIEECPQVMCRVCHCATSMTSLSSMDVVFNAGEIPASPKMYFLRDGQLQYVAITGHVSSLPDPIWISEAALWTAWMHLGTLTAVRESRMCVVDSISFQEIVNQFDHPDFDPRKYAAEFVKHLNSCAEPTDLPFGSAPGNEWETQGTRCADFGTFSGSVEPSFRSKSFRSLTTFLDPFKRARFSGDAVSYSQSVYGKDNKSVSPSATNYTIG